MAPLRRPEDVDTLAEMSQRARRERARELIAFIDADLDIAKTFVQMAATALEMHHVDHSNELVANARHAYTTIKKISLHGRRSD